MRGSEVEHGGIGELIIRRLDLESRFNIRPTQDVITIVSEHGRLAAKPMHWGLISSGSTPEKLTRKTFNVRDDRLAESPMWSGVFKRGRGVIPASGFFEWKRTNGSQQPMYFTLKEGEILHFAAVYDSLINERGETIDSCAIRSQRVHVEYS
ncbi:MAG: SOS response-associated peptidase family protein [Chloroflexi bacterium]|nr:SOS response-associated peptidase family protein [Chloroflexota bacterium]